MDFKDLVRRTRSYRRFQENHPITQETLQDLVDLARLSPSGRNLQPLKFLPCCDPAWNARIFPELGWAGYLPDWPGPIPGERPSAYLVVLGDRALTREFGVDAGLACQTILLGATGLGLGGCLIGSVQRERVREILAIPEHLEVLLVIALGKPVEEVRLEPLPADGSIKYLARPGRGPPCAQARAGGDPAAAAPLRARRGRAH